MKNKTHENRISIRLLPAAVLVLLATVFLLSGCGRQRNEIQPEGISYSLYFLNSSMDGLEPRPYTPDVSDADTEGLILEFMAQIKQAPQERGLNPLLPEDCKILDYSLDNGALTLNCSSAYSSMESSRELLTRAGIVRTFLQIDGIDCVQITIEGSSLKNASGSEVGFMTNNSFVENAGKTINSYKSVTMTLYFADETGTMLKQETRTVYYSTNEPLERAVIEELIKGPEQDGDYAVLPATTDILSVLTQDSVCYVNFDSSVSNSVLNLKAELPFYAIVNSLADTCETRKVQFTIDGKSDILYRNTVDLSEPFSRNDDLIENNSDDPASVSGQSLLSGS